MHAKGLYALWILFSCLVYFFVIINTKRLYSTSRASSSKVMRGWLRNRCACKCSYSLLIRLFEVWFLLIIYYFLTRCFHFHAQPHANLIKFTWFLAIKKFFSVFILLSSLCNITKIMSKLNSKWSFGMQ